MASRLGTYTLEKLVAQGGAGAVYRAHGPDGRAVAIKVLASLAGAPERIERALREARSLLRLDHPGVVRLLDVGREENGAPYLVLEWVEGEDLEARLAREGPLHPREAAALVAGLAGALAHCHEREVLHRDLKPGNVLLRASDGAALLGDFSLALELDRTTRLTQDGRPQGTPGWFAPEQAFGRRDAIGPRTDVWGLGAVLFATLTGRPPVVGDVATLFAALAKPIEGPRELRRDLPDALDALCRRCLALEPTARPEGPRQVERELTAWLARGRERRRTVGLGALSLVVLLAGAGAAWAVRERRQRAAAVERLAAEAARLAEAGDLEAGLRAAEEALALDPGAPRALSVRCGIRVIRRDLAGGLADVELALRRGESAPLLVRRGALFIDLERPAEAEADFARALALDPGCVEARVARGVLLLRRGDADGALAELSRTLELQPASLLALTHRGNLRRLQGDYRGALSDLDRALALAPDAPDTLGYRSAAREQSGDLQGALSDLERAIRFDAENPQHHLNRGRLLARARRATEALEACERALALDPDYARAWLLRGRTRASLGDERGGLSDMDRGIALDPAQAGAWTDRATLRMIAGDAAGAVADATKAIELDPKQAEAHGVLGVDAAQRGQLAEALVHYDRAVELVPDLVTVLRNRAVVRRDLGDLPGAVADLERCLALDPDNPEAPALDAERERLRARIR